MINNYYLLINGEQAGPYTQYQLMDMELDTRTMVLSPLAADWQELADLPEFAYYLENKGVYLPIKANLANFWWRVLAYIIDYGLLIMSFIILGSIYYVIYEVVNKSYPDSDLNSKIESLIQMAAFIVYHALCESSKLRGSIGKVACKLCVVNADGVSLTFQQALGRNAGKLLSGLILGLGFLRVLWDDKRQGWHDELAKAYVIRRK